MWASSRALPASVQCCSRTRQSLVQGALQPRAAFDFDPFSGGVYPLLARLLCTGNWDEQNTLHSEVCP